MYKDYREDMIVCLKMKIFGYYFWIFWLSKVGFLEFRFLIKVLNDIDIGSLENIIKKYCFGGYED